MLQFYSVSSLFFCYFSKHILDPKNVGLEITKKLTIVLERQLPYLNKKQFEHVHKPGGWAHRLIKSMWRTTSTLIKANQQKAFIAHPHLFRFKSSQTSSRRKLFNLQSGTIFSAKFLTHKQTTVQKLLVLLGRESNYFLLLIEIEILIRIFYN